MTTAAQLRAARSLLGMTQAQVATAAGLSVPTIKRAEGDGEIAAAPPSVAAIRSALERAGVVFISENGDGPGVRLKKI
jgi:transcriptional regulator with XRE-family HTH domain